jgi:putative transposase
MKQVTDTLGLARSNIAERVKGVRPKRGPQTRDGDLELAANIRRLVDARATYGYRRVAALLKRERRADGMAPVNAKRVYRLMKRHGLLLARHTGRRRPREHDGQVATLRSNTRWCSDGLEFTCWNGEIVRVAFALDCHDREVIGWVATTAGISGEMIRDMMVRCVEQRFGDIRAAASGAMAVRQRLNLRRPQDHRDRRGAQLGAVLHPGRKPGEQRHGRGLRQNLQARLCPRQPDPRCQYRARSHR